MKLLAGLCVGIKANCICLALLLVNQINTQHKAIELGLELYTLSSLKSLPSITFLLNESCFL